MISSRKALRKIIGDNNYFCLTGIVKYYRDAFWRIIKHTGHIQILAPDSRVINIYSIPNHHVFFGYYDIAQINSERNKLLAHVVSKNAKTSITPAQVGWFSLSDNVFHPIADTRAWCWQQGARLRWHPVNHNIILFNDIQNHKFVTRVYNLKTDSFEKDIERPLYDISSDGSFGLGLDFARLQRLRPGYGYDGLQDVTIDDKAPDQGIYRVDLEFNTVNEIVNLRKLAVVSDPTLTRNHYLNHISIAPDSAHFIFFHIWSEPNDRERKTQLIVAGSHGEELRILEETDTVSHYCWKSKHELIVTCFDKNFNQYYARYNILTGEKELIHGVELCKDGHPTVWNKLNCMITDTYPKEHDYQSLIMHSFLGGQDSVLVKLFSDPRMYGEKRCDLHPRLEESGLLTVDSTFSDRLRKIILFDINDIKGTTNE